MTRQEIATELKDYMFKIQTFSKDMGQDGNALHEYLITLTNYMARANLIMADYQKEFRDQKKKAYMNLIASETASQKYFAASLAKDFIDSSCSETGYIYDLAERLSRLCTHTIDSIRTIVSSLKQEKIFSQYGT